MRRFPFELIEWDFTSSLRFPTRSPLDFPLGKTTSKKDLNPSLSP